jgi:hypothetical protein
MPATRRVGSRPSSSSRAPCRSPRARVGGSRSEASGSRISETGEKVAVCDSKTQRMEYPCCRNRSVSPVARIRSTRQSSALRHHTRSWVFSPSICASVANDSLSGTCSVPEVSTYPDQPTSADCLTRPASSTAGMSEGVAGRVPITTGVATSAAAVNSTTSQRAVMAATVGRRHETGRDESAVGRSAQLPSRWLVGEPKLTL